MEFTLNLGKNELTSMVLDGSDAFVFSEEDRFWMRAEEGEESEVEALTESLGNNSKEGKVEFEITRKMTRPNDSVDSRKISKIKLAKKETRSKLRIKLPSSRCLGIRLSEKNLVAIF